MPRLKIKFTAKEKELVHETNGSHRGQEVEQPTFINVCQNLGPSI